MQSFSSKQIDYRLVHISLINFKTSHSSFMFCRQINPPRERFGSSASSALDPVDYETYPKIDTCHNLNGSSFTGHWI